MYLSTCLPSRTNVKLRNTHVTLKIVKKIITEFDSSKAYRYDSNAVVVLKNFETELTYILADLNNV